VPVGGKKGMKRIALVLTLILALLISLVAGVQTVKADSQTCSPFFSGINIISPSNNTYSSSLLTLNVSVTTLGGSNLKISMNYSLDGTYNQTIPVTIQYPTGNSFMLALHTGLVNLLALPEASHNITVYVEYEYPNNNKFVTPFPGTVTQFYDSTVYFTIGTNSEQEIPEFPSWTILPLFVIATLAVLICRNRPKRKGHHEEED
jgi:amino acid permease